MNHNLKERKRQTKEQLRAARIEYLATMTAATAHRMNYFDLIRQAVKGEVLTQAEAAEATDYSYQRISQIVNQQPKEIK